MSNELLFFRFYPSQWLNDEIAFETYTIKGVFVDVCAYYWFNDCEVSLKLLNKKFSNAKKAINLLIENGLIKVCEKNDKIEIKFLDEQRVAILKDKQKKSDAGRKGGLASAESRWSDA